MNMLLFFCPLSSVRIIVGKFWNSHLNRPVPNSLNPVASGEVLACVNTEATKIIFFPLCGISLSLKFHICGETFSSYNVRSHGYTHQNLAVLASSPPPNPHLGQWCQQPAGRSCWKGGANGSAVEVEDGRTKRLDPYFLGLWAPDSESSTEESCQVKEIKTLLKGTNSFSFYIWDQCFLDSGAEKCNDLFKITGLIGAASGFNCISSKSHATEFLFFFVKRIAAV